MSAVTQHKVLLGHIGIMLLGMSLGFVFGQYSVQSQKEQLAQSLIFFCLVFCILIPFLLLAVVTFKRKGQTYEQSERL